MKPIFGTLLKNVLPGLALVAIGTAGAYTVYKTSFQDKVSEGFANLEPAAGYDGTTSTSVFDERFIDTSWADSGAFPPAPQTVKNGDLPQLQAPDLEGTIEIIETITE